MAPKVLCKDCDYCVLDSEIEIQAFWCRIQLPAGLVAGNREVFPDNPNCGCDLGLTCPAAPNPL